MSPFAVLVLDHRQNLRKELHPEAPESATYEEVVAFKWAVIRALAPQAMISHRAPLSDAAQRFAALGAHQLSHRKIVFGPTA